MGLSSPFQAMNTRSKVSGWGSMVCLLLEGDQVIGVALHPGEPVEDKLVGLPPGQAQLGQGVLRISYLIFR